MIVDNDPESDCSKLTEEILDGSVMGPLQTVSEYAIQWLKKMQNENLRSWVPKQQITDQFNDHVQVRLFLGP